MKHIIETKKQKIYFDTYYYVLENAQAAIIGGVEYQQICFSDFEECMKIKCFDENVLYLKKIDALLEFYYFHKDLLQVRSKMFDLLQIIKNILRNELSIYAFETISYENDKEVYHIGLIDNELKYVNICNVRILNDEGLNYFVLDLGDALIKHLLSRLDNGELINSRYVPNLFGFVLLDENRQGVKKRYNELVEYLTECDFTILKADSSVSAKEQYTYLENEGVRWIIEVNYRKFRANLIKLKNVCVNEIEDITYDELTFEEMLRSHIDISNENTYKNYLNNYLKYQKTESIDIVCNTCVDEYFKKGYNVIKPLSNVVSNGKCCICNNKGNHKFFKI